MYSTDTKENMYQGHFHVNNCMHDSRTWKTICLKCATRLETCPNLLYAVFRVFYVSIYVYITTVTLYVVWGHTFYCPKAVVITKSQLFVNVIVIFVCNVLMLKM